MQNGGYSNLEYQERKNGIPRKCHFRGVTKMILQKMKIRLYSLPSKKNGFYANNYLFTIMDIIFLFLILFLILKEGLVFFGLIWFKKKQIGFFWFNLVFILIDFSK